jgi:hypothetical protein
MPGHLSQTKPRLLVARLEHARSSQLNQTQAFGSKVRACQVTSAKPNKETFYCPVLGTPFSYTHGWVMTNIFVFVFCAFQIK